MTTDYRPRLRWDARRQVWREWNRHFNRWSPFFLRKCVKCEGEFIGANHTRMCRACGDPLMKQRLAITGAAHRVVAHAKKHGRLSRLDGSVICVDCGGTAVCYDHRDYAAPLNVDPVCRKCNVRRGPAVGLEHLSRRTA